MRNKILRSGAPALWVAAFALLSGCGGNSTPVGVTVAPNPAVVPLGGQQQFQANVTGTSTTSVTWQLCLVPTPTNAQPTVCSPATTGQTQMPSGYGIVTTGQTNTPPGGFYTAPAVLSPTNDFLVVATSTVNTKIFGISVVHLDSTIRVAISPTSATIAPGDSFTLTANVTSTTNTAVTWEVNGIAGGDVTDGFIVPGGGNGNTATYTAPTNDPPGSVTITAVSAADPAESGSATITVITSAAPALTSAVPNIVGEGSAQQEVFLTGTNFTSNSVVMVGTPPAPVPTLFLGPTLLRATIPASPLSVAGSVSMVVQAQNGDLSNVLTGPTNGLTVMPSRPAVVALTPDTMVPNGGTAGVNLIGGFFSPSTVVNCNGTTQGTRVATTLTSSQQLGVTIPSTCAPAPGQYPLFVQNTDVMAPNPAMSAVNLTVEPRPSDISTGVSSTFPVGASPVGIAIDPALNLAVIANSGSNSVSIVNLGTLATTTVPVGTAPTSVAIDDQVTTAGGALGDHIAVVTNSGDNTISVIDLTTMTAAPAFALPNPNTPPNAQPVPFAIGINPLTHRGLIAFQSTNNVLIMDFSAGVPTVIQTLGGTLTPIGTGTNPKVAVDPLLNWALITPGGSGVIAIVDMGRNPGVGASPADFGRSPVVIASLSISSTVEGVGINAATHQAVFADPQGPNQVPAAPSVSSFSMLDQSVSSVPFTQGGIPFTNLGLVAAAVNPLANIGIVVNGTANNGFVLDLANNLVLQTVAGLNSPQAVAVNPLTNTAYIVNQGNNTVSVFPMATITPNPLQILETSPSTTFVQSPAAGLTLSIIGTGFTGASQVFLDGGTVPTTLVSSRQLTAAIPSSDLMAARRYAVYVQSSGATSNVSGLTVIQPVAVGTSPVGVAVDPYLDQAVVTNSGSNSISVVNLLDGSQITPQSPSFFATGAIPYGVGILARTGQAVVGNNGSNTITVLDEKGLNNVFNAPVNFSLCSACTLPLGVTVDQDSGLAAVTDTIASEQICQNTSPTNNGGGLASFLVPGSTSGTAASDSCVDFIPLAVAIDPVLNNDPAQTMAAVTVASQFNGLDLLPLPAGAVTRIQMQLPTGVVFDALNGVFVVADSTANNVILIDPLTTQTAFTASAGINPTSLDYNFNSSTLVTSNAASNTLSILAYVCPPNANGVSNCPVPRVREILDVGTVEPLVSVVVGPNSIAIDPRLNLAVQIDQANNRILLVPLPH
jgi:DNA-binding beta-propeller fold protein YncE